MISVVQHYEKHAVLTSPWGFCEIKFSRTQQSKTFKSLKRVAHSGSRRGELHLGKLCSFWRTKTS